MVEVPTAPTPPQGRLQVGLFQTWPAGASKLLYRRVPSGRARRGAAQSIQPKKGSKPRFPHDSSLRPGLVTAGPGFRPSALAARAGKVFCAIAAPSRREELGRALSIAVLGYGVPVGVLVLHALG